MFSIEEFDSFYETMIGWIWDNKTLFGNINKLSFFAAALQRSNFYHEEFALWILRKYLSLGFEGLANGKSESGQVEEVDQY